MFPADQGFYLFLKIFCVLFDFSVIAFIIYVWITSPYLRRMWFWDVKEFFNYHAYMVRRINKDWNKIIGRVKTNMETEFKLAVIEADLLLNEVLLRLGYAGANLTEKLEKTPKGKLSNHDQIREADLIYQKIVHDPSYKLSRDETKKAILIFEQAFKDLDAF